MAEQTSIEWCDHTFNPWTGCTKVSPGCRNCYAETLRARFGHGNEWGPNGIRTRTSESYWRQPLKWDHAAAEAGVRRRVFCASLADVFEDRPELGEWRSDLWELIRATPNLDWLLLTKRPENFGRMASGLLVCGRCHWRHIDLVDDEHPWCGWCENEVEAVPSSNVWFGTSVENQGSVGRLDYLDVDVRTTFLSCEPLLGPLDFGTYGLDGIDWVIVGGESGPNARPMHPEWVRSIRDQCVAAGVPFLFKQWGEHDENGVKVGKKAAGRVLDGRVWDEYPRGNDDA